MGKRVYVGLVSIVGCLVGASAVKAGDGADPQSLWGRDNRFAWTVAPFDAVDRSPEERAEMLEKLGFKAYAYSWRDKDIPEFDAEIEALKERGIKLIGWNMLRYEIEDPPARASLEAMKRHDVYPQLWVKQSVRHRPEELAKILPMGFAMPKTPEEWKQLSAADEAILQKAMVQLREKDLPKTPEEQLARVDKEADRIRAIVEVAESYRVKVALYNHNGWFGIMDNQVAIIERLKERGVSNVGIVYNFSHARDELHDDTVNFAAIWKNIKSYVAAVNITGMCWEGTLVYPSQGDSELEMMRIIQDSGWRGPVGLIAEKGGDAEVTLRNYITGLDWLAAELKQPGSGGPRPFPLAPQRNGSAENCCSSCR